METECLFIGGVADGRRLRVPNGVNLWKVFSPPPRLPDVAVTRDDAQESDPFAVETYERVSPRVFTCCFRPQALFEHLADRYDSTAVPRERYLRLLGLAHGLLHNLYGPKVDDYGRRLDRMLNEQLRTPEGYDAWKAADEKLRREMNDQPKPAK